MDTSLGSISHIAVSPSPLTRKSPRTCIHASIHPIIRRDVVCYNTSYIRVISYHGLSPQQLGISRNNDNASALSIVVLLIDVLCTRTVSRCNVRTGRTITQSHDDTITPSHLISVPKYHPKPKYQVATTCCHRISPFLSLIFFQQNYVLCFKSSLL